MIETLNTPSENVLGFRFSGKMHDEDYQQLEQAVQSAQPSDGKLRMLAQLQDFHGWDAKAAWDDLKFGIKHYRDFDRIAVIGDHRWQSVVTSLTKPFTQAKVRYFDITEEQNAHNWLEEEAER